MVDERVPPLISAAKLITAISGKESVTMVEAPELTTGRLLLRAHRVADYAECCALWANPDVTRFIGGRPFAPEDVWTRILRYAGHWPLLGYGYWLIADRNTGAVLGECGFMDRKRALNPSFHDRPEAGWTLLPAVWGQGIAREAMDAALAWADTHLKAATVCMIQPDNIASIRLAVRLGYRAYAEAEYAGVATRLFSRVGV